MDNVPLSVLVKIKKPSPKNVSDIAAPFIKELSFCFSNKTIVFTDDRAYSFYWNNDTRRNILKRIERYNVHVLYPMSEYFSISLKDYYTVTRRVPGRSYYDKQHHLFLARELLNIAGQSSTIERPEKYKYLDSDTFKNIRFHIQHGDMKNTNILWQDDFHYCMVDFDGIDIFPTFYDFFYYILSGGFGLEEYLSNYFDQEILKYMTKQGINEPLEKYKDECLAAFILVPGKYIPDDKIIRKIVPGDYYKSRESIAVMEINRAKEVHSK